MKSKESRPYLGFLKEYAFKKKLLPSYILTIATIVLTAGVSLVRPELQGKVIDDLGNPHSTSFICVYAPSGGVPGHVTAELPYELCTALYRGCYFGRDSSRYATKGRR